MNPNAFLITACGLTQIYRGIRCHWPVKNGQYVRVLSAVALFNLYNNAVSTVKINIRKIMNCGTLKA
jgi:hypothetical protein